MIIHYYYDFVFDDPVDYPEGPDIFTTAGEGYDNITHIGVMS
jgi:hypothetical protein